jgi:hypothetical protein
VQLEVLLVVPGQRRDAVALAYAQRGKRRAQAIDPFGQLTKLLTP